MKRNCNSLKHIIAIYTTILSSSVLELRSWLTHSEVFISLLLPNIQF